MPSNGCDASSTLPILSRLRKILLHNPQHCPTSMATNSPKPYENSRFMFGSNSISSTSGLICGPVKDETGGTWGVLVVAEPVGGTAFGEENLNIFR